MAKYSKAAGKKVEDALHEMKEGELKSGSGKKVTSRKQAIAIGLSEARERGAKVPSKKSASKGASKSSAGGTKKAAAKKGTSKSAAGKKTASKSTARKGATRSASSRSK